MYFLLKIMNPSALNECFLSLFWLLRHLHHPVSHWSSREPEHYSISLHLCYTRYASSPSIDQCDLWCILNVLSISNQSLPLSSLPWDIRQPFPRLPFTATRGLFCKWRRWRRIAAKLWEMWESATFWQGLVLQYALGCRCLRPTWIGLKAVHK